MGEVTLGPCWDQIGSIPSQWARIIRQRSWIGGCRLEFADIEDDKIMLFFASRSLDQDSLREVSYHHIKFPWLQDGGVFQVVIGKLLDWYLESDDFGFSCLQFNLAEGAKTLYLRRNRGKEITGENVHGLFACT